MGELTLGTEDHVAFKRHSFAVAQMAFPEKGGSSGLDAVRCLALRLPPYKVPLQLAQAVLLVIMYPDG